MLIMKYCFSYEDIISINYIPILDLFLHFLSDINNTRASYNIFNIILYSFL